MIYEMPKYSVYYRLKNMTDVLIYVGMRNGWFQFSHAYSYDGEVVAELTAEFIGMRCNVLEVVPTPLDLPTLTDDLATNLDALMFVKPKTTSFNEALDAHLDNSFYK